MPLSAYYLGSRLESWSMSAEQWARLKGEYRDAGLTMACGQEGVPKTSSRGLQFFAHKPGSGCLLHEGGPESPEHLATKAAVAEAARALGWTATLECPSKDRTWIADVLLRNGPRALVVEAQWSRQELRDFERRQARYDAAGIECIWLVAEVNARNAATVPHYVISGTAEDLVLRLPSLAEDVTCELRQGITRILCGDVAKRVEFRPTAAVLLTQKVTCWKCHEWITLWMVERLQLLSRCGSIVTMTWPDPWPLWMPQRHEQVLSDLVCSAIAASGMPQPVTLARRHSDPADKEYIAMICPHCNYVQGDGHLDWSGDFTQYSPRFPVMLKLAFSDRVLARLHLCRDVGNGRCFEGMRLGGAAGRFPPAHENFEITGDATPRRALPALPEAGLQRPRGLKDVPATRTSSTSSTSFAPTTSPR